MATRAMPEVGELHRLTTDDFHRMGDAGIFPDDIRIELLDGLLVRRSVMSPEHANVLMWLNQELVLAIDRDRFRLRPQCPVTLEPYSEPVPDLAVTSVDAPTPYHPATAVLVIEISKSSLRRDLGYKAGLYAEFGMPDYWVIDVEGPRAIVHRKPGADGYDELEEVRAGSELVAEALRIRFAFDDLVRAAGL